MTRRRWLALASLLGLAGLVVFFAWPSERPLPGLDSDAPRFSWPQGLVRQYRLLAEGSSVVPSPDDGKPMSGVASTEATLELRGYGVHDGRVVLGLRLTKLLTAKMTLFGQPAMQDRAALEAALVGPEAFLSFLPTGDLVQVRFERDVNNTFKGLAELVAGELQAPLRKGASYTLIETTTRGRAKTVFTAGDGSLTKQRVRYVSLSGFGKGAVDLQLEGLTSLTLSPEGQPLRVTTHERLFTAQSSSVQDLTLIAEGEARFAGALPTQPLVEAKLDELTVPADAREQILSQRIAGLTEAELFASVEAYGLAGTLPDLGLFMGRATGLLIKHPELCARLAERASRTSTSPQERTFALELLASAGGPTAQAALRDILSSENVAKDPLGRRAFLRTTLVRHPTPETVAFVAEKYRSSTGADRDTVALALGATAGALAREGHPDLAEPVLEQLKADLARARETREREHLLAALGNAGLEKYAPDVLAFAADPDADVRYTAIDSLRKMPTPQVRGAVSLAVSDADARVAAKAVEVLGDFHPDGAERQAIINAMRNGQLAWRDAATVINALAPYAADAQVRAFFQWLARQDALDPSQRTRLQNILQGGLSP